MTKAQRVALFFLGIGAAWRYDFVFRAHPATRYVYSDMQGYHEWAQRFFNANAAQSIADTFHPPGAAIFLGFLYSVDPTWTVAMSVQWLLACSTLVLIYLIADELYGAAVATVSLAMAALYYPFVHYAGYFLMENPFTFFVCLTMWLFIRSLRATTRWHATGIGLAAGLAAGVAGSLKNSVLGSVIVLGIGFALLAAKHRFTRAPAILAACALGITLLFVPMSVRCTRLNEGRFCLAATNSACNVLMGHYGRKGLFRWHDKKRGIEIHFGSPTSYINGWDEPVDLDFGVYDAHENLALAWQWISAHPVDSLLESGRHVFDLFFGRTIWPSADDGLIPWGAWSQRLFWLFILLPAVCLLAMRARPLWQLQWGAQAELILFLPILGLMATVFISVSEVRYRVPFDGLIIILAARLYTLLAGRLRSWARRNLRQSSAPPIQLFGG